jgi:RHS repeat-associated protein
VKTISPTGVQNKVTYAWDSPSGFPFNGPSNRLGVYSIKTETEGSGYIKEYCSSNGEVIRSESQDYAGQTVVSDTRYNFGAAATYPNGVILEKTEAHYPSQQKFLIDHYDYELNFFRPKLVTTFSTSSGNPSSASSTGIFSQTTYNNQSTDAGYNTPFVETTNQNNQIVTRQSNSAGQTEKVQNTYPSLQQNALYVYSSTGNPKSITLTTPSNPGQNIVHSFAYDGLGLKAQQTDPSMGVSTYAYNTLGELLQSTSPSGTFNYTYDVLGRVLTKTGSQSGVTTYQYVTSGNGEQLPDKVFSPNSTAEFKYDAFNRLIEDKETLTSNNKVLKTSYTYDVYGREMEHTYPGGFITKNQYNADGHLIKISNASNQPLWQLVSKDALGRILEYSYGNGIVTKNTFDDLHYLTGIDHGNSSIHKQTYTYNNLTGNLTSRIFEDFTANTALKELFSFDALDRLTQSKQRDFVSNNQIQVNDLTIDILGNITHKDDAGDLAYSTPGKPFTLTQINNPSPNINPNTLNVQYNDFDKVKQISEMGSNKQMDLTYGTSGQRIRQVYALGGNNQYTRYYAADYDRQETTNAYKDWTYISAPSGLCAVYYDNNGTSELNYVLSDHLGSPILLTGTNSINPGIVERYSFDSWGRRRNPANWSYSNIPVPQKMIRGYTLHEHLDEFAMINMNGRVYDPVIGRFIQPDDVIQSPDNLQNYNRYAYCFNNPLRYNDPTGHYGEDPTYGYYASGYSFGATTYGSVNYLGYSANYSASWSQSGYGSVTYDAQNITYSYGSSWSTSYGVSFQDQYVSWSQGGSFSGSYSTPNPAYISAQATEQYNRVMADNNLFFAKINDYLGYAGQAEAGLSASQIGILEYRQSMDIMSKIGTYSQFSSVFSVLGTTGKILGRASTYIGAPLNTYLDYKSMNGEFGDKISAERFSYRTIGTAVGIGVGTFVGAIPGAAVGGGFWTGEKMYDGYNYWQLQMSINVTNFENGLNQGWLPR